jgi:hypothetical protein
MSIHVLDTETDASVSFHGKSIDDLRGFFLKEYDVDLTSEGLLIVIDDLPKNKTEATK